MFWYGVCISATPGKRYLGGRQLQTSPKQDTQQRSFRLPVWLGFCLFLGIALFFLWEEHRAHILGAVPYLLVLLCPLIHLFMHRDHRGHGADQSGDGRHGSHQ